MPISSTTYTYKYLFEQEYAAEYKAYFFRQFHLLHNNQQVGNSIWRRNKAKLLLKWFLLNPNKLFSSDQLIDLFWPDIEAEIALNYLHVTIHALRHIFEPGLAPRQESSFLHQSKRNFYWFEPGSAWWTDVWAIQQLYDEAKDFDRRAEYEKAVFRFRKISFYCKGGFLPEDDENGVFHPYRQYYDQIYYQTLLQLIKHCLSKQALEEVLEYAHQALEVDRYCEPAIKAIVNVYHQKGDTATAIDWLNKFQLLLRQELGIEAGKDIRALRTTLEQS